VDKKDFIDTIFTMYPNSFTKRVDVWRNAYELALPEKMDYEKLFDWMLVTYHSTSQAPAPSFFKKFIQNYQIAQIQREQIQQAYENRKQWEETERLLQKQLLEAEKALPEKFQILEPLEVLKRSYTTPQEFIRSMFERQAKNPCHATRGNYIFFTDYEWSAFREYQKELKLEAAKSIFWRKVMALIGKQTPFNELCTEYLQQNPNINPIGAK